MIYSILLNSSPPEQNGYHFADDTFKRIFIHEDVRTLIEISLKIVPRGPIKNDSALVQVMAWCWPGDKSLPEPILAQFIDGYMWH